MAITISVHEDEGRLQVSYAATAVTGDELAEQRRQVAEAISDSGLTNVLIDATALAHFPSPFTVLEHNVEIAAHSVLRRARFAVVCAQLAENERCLEDTGANRGVQMRCFTSREEALAWLG